MKLQPIQMPDGGQAEWIVVKGGNPVPQQADLMHVVRLGDVTRSLHSAPLFAEAQPHSCWSASDCRGRTRDPCWPVRITLEANWAVRRRSPDLTPQPPSLQGKGEQWFLG